MAVKDQTSLHEAVSALREELARLADRISALEAAGTGPAVAAAPKRAAAPVPAPAPTPAPVPEISEELLLVISSAVAAFLGKKPYIRQVRLVTSPTWTHQGRVGVQTSHAIAMHYRSGASA